MTSPALLTTAVNKKDRDESECTGTQSRNGQLKIDQINGPKTATAGSVKFKWEL